MDSIIYNGWLEKKGHIISSSKKRFFILENRVLKYFTSDDLSNKKGEYVIDAHSRVELSKTNPLVFTLYAKGSGGTELELKAKTIEEVLEWKNILENCRNNIDLVNDYNSSKIPMAIMKDISPFHQLQDIGISPSVAVLQYDEIVLPASEELQRDKNKYLMAFEVSSPPSSIRYPHEKNHFYTLILLNPDYPDSSRPEFKEYIHWVSC
jgi:hypothetical protein